MAVRLAALLPRLVAVALIWLLATATLTFAADKRLSTTLSHKHVAPVTRPEIVVPDVRNQAFVFAKGLLDDAGLAWRVTGGVRGYATNIVLTQSPAPGTRVVDTGAPTITVHLARGHYPQDGFPEDQSAYPGTAIVLPGVHARPAKPAKRAKPVVKPKKRAKPARPAKHKAKHHAAKPKPKPKKAAAKTRRPDFVVPGAPREPGNEMSLPARARLLSAWLTPSRTATNANVRHWLYQHAWIVTGARFGWWHGAQALRTLIQVDKRIEARWGMGTKSESAARAMLARAEARGR